MVPPVNIRVKDKSRKHTEEDQDEDLSSVGTVTSESIELSLPESFDDTISLNGFPIKIPRNDKNSKQETYQLHKQLNTATQKINELKNEYNTQLKDLQTIENYFLDGEEYNRLKNIPSCHRNILQSARLIIHESIESQKRDVDIERQRVQNLRESALRQQEEASNTMKLCEYKEKNLREALDIANDRKSELEMRMSELQSNMIELQEKGRKFDDMGSNVAILTEEIKKTRLIISEKQKEIDQMNTNYADQKMKIKDLDKKVQILEMDKAFAKKEKTVILERAEKAESENKQKDILLRQALSENDDLNKQLGEANLAAKSAHNAIVSDEIKNIREKSKNEFDTYRNQVESAYQREIQVLREAKTDISKQLDKSKHEAEELRCMLEKVNTEKDETVNNLERTLSDIRSDIKIKCIECTKLHTTNEELEAKVKDKKLHLDMLTDQLRAFEKEFKNLERESMYERNRLVDELTRKDEQLEVYFQDQIHKWDLIKKDKGSKGIYRDSSIPQNMHLLDKASELSKECTRLEGIIRQLQEKLRTQTERLQQVEQKLIKAEKSLKESNEELDQKRNENDMMMSRQLLEEKDAMEKEIRIVNKEKEILTRKFSDVLERYHRLVLETNRGNDNASSVALKNRTNSVREQNDDVMRTAAVATSRTRPYVQHWTVTTS